MGKRIAVAPTQLVPPFPYFGGKRSIAHAVWPRFGKLRQYIEPFCGGAAMLLASPNPPSLEVIGDVNGFVANFWRALSCQPDEVVRWADYPSSHVDLSARHRWLLERRQAIAAGLTDASYPGDAQAAGWWAWGQCCWIGSGWAEWDRTRPLADGIGQVPNLTCVGQGYKSPDHGTTLLRTIATRLRGVIVVHGSWDRCLNTYYAANYPSGVAGIFLDPPYVAFEGLYGAKTPVAHDVAAWCRENQNDPHKRIVLCGHVGDYDLPGWDVVQWKRSNGTMGGAKTRDQEAIWFSPTCLPAQRDQTEMDWSLFSRESA